MRHSPVGFIGPFQAPYSPTSGMSAIIAGRRAAVVRAARRDEERIIEARRNVAAKRTARARRRRGSRPCATIDSRSAFSVVAMFPLSLARNSAFEAASDGGSLEKSSDDLSTPSLEAGPLFATRAQGQSCRARALRQPIMRYARLHMAAGRGKLEAECRDINPPICSISSPRARRIRTSPRSRPATPSR